MTHHLEGQGFLALGAVENCVLYCADDVVSGLPLVVLRDLSVLVPGG